MSKRVVSLLLTLLLALSVCIPVFATAVEPADQSETTESEAIDPETEPEEEAPIEKAPVEETPTEEEPSEEEPAEEAPTGQPETTETEEETETSSDATPEDPATSEEEQDNSDEIATIASGTQIPVKIVGENSDEYDKRAFYFEDAKSNNGTLSYPIPDQTRPGNKFTLFVHHGYTLESVSGCTVSVERDNYSVQIVRVDVNNDASEVQIKVIPTDMITLKLLGAPDKLEIEDEFGEKVTDGLVVPDYTKMSVKSGLDSGYIVEENVEIEYSSGGAGGVCYLHSESDGDTVEEEVYRLDATDQDNNGIVTFNIVKGVLVVLNDPDDGIYFSEDGWYYVIPSVLHVDDNFTLLVKPGFSITVIGGSSDGAYVYDEKTGDPLYRSYFVEAGAEETLVINVEKTDEPIPPYQPEEKNGIDIKYENESAFIGDNPDHFDLDSIHDTFSVYVNKDYTIKAQGAKVYFIAYYSDIEHSLSTDDLNQAVGKKYEIFIVDPTVTEVTLTAVKGSHNVKLVVEGDKSALISGGGLNVDGDILKEGVGKIRLKNGYILEYSRDSYFNYSKYDNLSNGRRYDVFGEEIFREYAFLVPTDIDTLTAEVVKTTPSRWIEVSVNKPDDILFSLDVFYSDSYEDYLINEKGNFVFLYDDNHQDYGGEFENQLPHSILCEITMTRGYQPEVEGGTERFDRWSTDDESKDVFYIIPDEGTDKITITLMKRQNIIPVFPPEGGDERVNEEILYGTVMHLLEMTDPEDPELAKLQELLEKAVGKDVTAEVVMKKVSKPSGNSDIDNFNGNFDAFMDIHIDIKIDGKVVGTIGTTDEPLSFIQEYKEELGKIIVVMREHNGNNDKLSVKIDGDTIEFSSDIFSIFAIGYTNDINYADVKRIPNQEYTGKPVEPEVVVTANGKPLTLGQDYTVTYENNVEEGVATVIITGINGFEGKKEVQFVIGNGELPSEPSKPSTKPTPTPKPDYGIIPDVPWYQYQPEDEGEYVPGPDEVTYSFPDVDPNAWYAGPVDWAAQSGVTAGYPDGNFHPDDTCTRAQIVTFLWKAAGTPMSVGTTSFSDVEQGSFYYDAAVWAANSGIIAGYPDGNFHPDDPCTRAQIVAMLYRYANSPAVSGESKFFDVDASAYYYNAAIWAEQNGIVAGYPDGGFHPDDACTRAQIVTMLYNYIKG